VSAQPTPSSASGQLAGTLNVGGSTALRPLVEQAAKSFQAANPGVQIVVSDGGSGAGRSGVCQGSLDIGMSDVTLLGSEISSLNCGDAIQTAVAMDVFVVGANPSGPGNVAALDREQMEAIFSGAVKNWAQVGGNDQPLVVINRIKGSGTRQSMANYLFNGDDTLFQGNLAEQESNEDVANILSNTPGAVSYVGVAYLSDPGLVTLGIQRPDGIVLPTREVIAGLGWPIGGPGVAITKGQPNGLEAAFINYMISSQFQSDPIWNMLGYIPPARPAIGNPIGQ
jgi:phosphate transport system substrate-binding protein